MEMDYEEEKKKSLVAARDRLENCKSFVMVASTNDNKIVNNTSIQTADQYELISMIRTLSLIIEQCWLTVEEFQKEVQNYEKEVETKHGIDNGEKK